jgi:translation initiation factor 1
MTKRISTEGETPFEHNPFGGLDASGLPDAPKPPPQTPRAKKEKKFKGRVEVRREKAGRGGKTVTSLSEFPTHIAMGDLEALALQLRRSCACGGTLKGRVIELQGDVRDRAIPELERLGFTPVRAGG